MTADSTLCNHNNVPVLLEFVLLTPETLTDPNEVPKIEVSPEVRAVNRASRAEVAEALSAPVNEIVSSTFTEP